MFTFVRKMLCLVTSIALMLTVTGPSPLSHALEGTPVVTGTQMPTLPVEEVDIDSSISSDVPSSSLDFSGPLSQAESNGTVVGGIVSFLANHPQVTTEGFNSKGRPDLPGYVTFKAFNETNFSYRYDLGAGKGATVDVILHRDATTMDFSTSPLLMKLKRENDDAGSDGISELTVVFRDSGNNEIERRIQLSSLLQDYEFDLEEAGFDDSSVTHIILRFTYEDMDISKVLNDRKGEIMVTVGGLDMPVLSGVTGFNSDFLTEFPDGTQIQASGLLRGDHTLPGFITLLDPQDSIQSFRYDVGGSAGAVVQTEILPPAGQSFISNKTIVMGMKNNGNGANALVRVVDTGGNERQYVLNLTDSFQNFHFNLNGSGLPLDEANIEKVIIEIDRKLSPERLGVIDFYLPIDAPDPFTQVKPAIDSVNAGVDGQTTVDFPDIQDAVVYQVQIATDQDFTNIIHEGFPVLSQEIFTLTQSGNYFARMRASKDNQVEVGPVTQWSDPFPFNAQVIFDQKTVVNSADTRQTDGITEIAFDAIPNVVTYEVQVATDQNFTNIVHDGFPTGTTETVELQDGDYFVRVRGSLDADFGLGLVSDWSDVFAFTRSLNQEDPFTQIKPVIDSVDAGADGQTTVEFAGIQDAVLYQVQIATDQNFTNIIHEGFPAPSQEIFSLAQSGNYFARIRASKNSQVEVGPLTQWSDVFPFNVQVIFDQKSTITKVETNTVDGITRIDFDVIPGANIYHVQIARDANFTDIIHEGFPTGNLESVNLGENGDFFTRVRGSISPDFNLNLLSQWSDTFAFTRNVASRNVFPDVSLTGADITNFPDGGAGPLGITSVGPGVDAFDFAIATEGGVKVQYGTGTQGWAGGGFSYDDFSTQLIETGDMSGFKDIVFGIRADDSMVKLELIDDQGNKSSVQLLGVRSGIEQFWRIPLAFFNTIDLSKLRLIYFIVEGQNKQGEIDVNRIPPPLEVAPSTTLTTADIVDFSNGKIQSGEWPVVTIAPEGTTADLIQIDDRSAELQYDTSTQGWVAMGVTFDDFGTPATETEDLSSLLEFHFGIKGDEPSVKLVLEDVSGNQSFVVLTGISSTVEQVWSIPISLFTGVDLTSLKLIFFLIEGQNKTGSLIFANQPTV